MLVRERLHCLDLQHDLIEDEKVWNVLAFRGVALVIQRQFPWGFERQRLQR